MAPCWRLFGCLGVLRGSCSYKYASWSVLVLSWVRVGASWCVLGASWGVLGVSYRRLRPDLGTSWGYFLIVLVPVSGYSGDGKRFCEVVCVRRLEAERLDGFHFVGRAQRASERSERCERSVGKVLRSTCIPKGLRQRELASYVFEGSR